MQLADFTVVPRMLDRRQLIFAAALAAGVAAARPALAIGGNSLALKTGGVNSGGSYVLNNNGYVGTYINVTTPGEVTIAVNAAGTASGGVLPRMNIVVADYAAGFDVTPGVNTYQHTVTLPAGLHFVRTEFANDALQTSRALTVQTLDVTGATLANSNTNANALAAADNYIANFRRGPARLSLVGVDPGTPVDVRQVRHDFRFGTAVGGTTLNGVNQLLNNANYSSRLRENFNMLSQSNAGKWLYNESTRNVVTMAAVDRFFQYGEQHGMDVRVHNMLWGDNQQPNWVNTLLNDAAAGSEAAKDSLRAGISNRIRYYVGDGNPATADRASRYVEMDVINEHCHQPKYWNVYGVEGVAGIFNEAAAAIAAAGAPAKLYLNEYNVFQWGDSYGNWYRTDADALLAAGGAVGGLGIQYYPTATNHSAAVHSPARMQQVLQNLSVTGLPISLTEFGVGTGDNTTLTQAATYLTDTMRMIFGTPNATTFTMWGFWANDVWSAAPLAALYDSSWNLTSVGVAYQQLMRQWDTELVLEVGPNGSVDFTGFYGSYEVKVDGKTYFLKLDKGVSDYSLVVDLASDFDGNGTVDAADLGVWQQAFESGTAAGDADGDGDSDGSDLLVWQQQLGLMRSTPLSTAAATPEPASWTLLAGCGVLLASAARRRGTERFTVSLPHRGG